MPRIGASMAQVSTTFVPVEPDLYTCNIKKPVFEVKNGRARVQVPLEIIFGEETDQENHGRVITEFIHLHKKDGEENEIGTIQIKRYFEAALDTEDWDDERWEDADTDELEGGQVQVQAVIEDYETGKKNPDGTPEIKKNNKINRVLPV